MRTASIAASLLVALAGVGCGGPVPTPAASAPRTGPHGGVIAPLPADSGFVEILVEPADGELARLAAYFLGPDASAPLSPAPAAATIRLKLPNGSEPEIALRPDVAQPGRLASAPGPYLVDQLYGSLTADVGGSPATIPFARAQ